MAKVEQRLREWLEGPESSEPGDRYVLSQQSACDLLDALDEARGNAAELVAANWRNIAEKDAELRALRAELNRLRSGTPAEGSRDKEDGGDSGEEDV